MKKVGRPRKPEGAPTQKRVVARKPLTADEVRFCTNYCETGNQAEAYRSVWPEQKNPHAGANRLMRRIEVREFINSTLEAINRRGADAAARALLLRLDVADARLAEILTMRRRSRGEMLTRDTRQLQMAGVTPKLVPPPGGKGRPSVELQKTPEFEASLEQSAPVEDADLLKAIDLTYKRRVGYPQKAGAPDAPNPVNVFLYEPKWKVAAREPKTIEAEIE
jgi:hypothetical protein